MDMVFGREGRGEEMSRDDQGLRGVWFRKHGQYSGSLRGSMMGLGFDVYVHKRPWN